MTINMIDLAVPIREVKPFSFPATMSEDGFHLIQEQMITWGLPYPHRSDIENLGNLEWVVTRHEYATGTFPKRLSKWLHKEYGQSFTPEQLARIGTLAREHTSAERHTYFYDITDTIDWDDGDFGDSGSCYWGSNRGARAMLDENHCLALRFFKDAEGDEGIGRCWLYRNSMFWIIWNAYFNNTHDYGAHNSCAGLQLVGMARLLATEFGLSYKRIALENGGMTGGLLWINNGAGYMIGPDEVIQKYGHYDLHFSPTSYCCDCGYAFDEDELVEINGGLYCEECRDERFCYCEGCDSYVNNDDVVEVHGERRSTYMCESCARECAAQCQDCGDWFDNDLLTTVNDDLDYCSDCFDELTIYTCDDCGDYYTADYIRTLDDDGHSVEDTVGITHHHYCHDCFADHLFIPETVIPTDAVFNPNMNEMPAGRLVEVHLRVRGQERYWFARGDFSTYSQAIDVIHVLDYDYVPTGLRSIRTHILKPDEVFLSWRLSDYTDPLVSRAFRMLRQYNGPLPDVDLAPTDWNTDLTTMPENENVWVRLQDQRIGVGRVYHRDRAGQQTYVLRDWNSTDEISPNIQYYGGIHLQNSGERIVAWTHIRTLTEDEQRNARQYIQPHRSAVSEEDTQSEYTIWNSPNDPHDGQPTVFLLVQREEGAFPEIRVGFYSQTHQQWVLRGDYPDADIHPSTCRASMGGDHIYHHGLPILGWVSLPTDDRFSEVNVNGILFTKISHYTIRNS